jgi:DNA polymerase Ligase (LigD)
MFNFNCPNRFIVDEHAAMKAGLHHDLRFEARVGGKCVLISFATRKFKQLLSGELKRIELFRTPDHSLKWLTFEGDIEEGYGKGKVTIFDEGRYDVVSNKKDAVALFFRGKKWYGGYAFVSIGDDRWLLVRMHMLTKEYKTLLVGGK